MADCPDCGRQMHGRKCPCGWQPVALAKHDKPVDPDAGRCAYQAPRDRCRMRGEWSPSTTGSAKWYCGWHAAAFGRPELLDEFAEFERWLLLGRAYCSVWHHYEAPALWELVRGTVPDVKPEPCELPSCSLRLDVPVGPVTRRPVEKLTRQATHELPAWVTAEEHEARKRSALERAREAWEQQP
ncbi:MAG TPA: hypothetical protein VEA38_13870 [Terriglobales bacterium]|nr:hypothetical protein [Terriglobales bacterium]